MVDLTEPGADNRFLRLITVAGAKPALSQLEAAEAQFAQNAAYAPYRKVRLESVDYRGYDTADWEFTFNRGGSRQHVNNRGFVVSDNQAYGIYWQTTDARWKADRDDLQLVFDSFRPKAG